MRKNKAYTLFAGLLTLLALTGCKEEYDPIGNRIYINEAAFKNVKSVPVNVGEKTVTDFTVRIADIMSKDVNATLVVDETILNEYNEKTLANYSLLPADKHSFNMHCPSE